MRAFIPKNLNNEIEVIFQKNKEAARLQDAIVTRYDRLNDKQHRRDDVKEFFKILWKNKYKLQSLENLKQKHFTVVFDFYATNGQALSTLDGKLNNLRTFCGWIGKQGMVEQWLISYITKPIQNANSES